MRDIIAIGDNNRECLNVLRLGGGVHRIVHSITMSSLRSPADLCLIDLLEGSVANKKKHCNTLL